MNIIDIIKQFKLRVVTMQIEYFKRNKALCLDISEIDMILTLERN